MCFLSSDGSEGLTGFATEDDLVDFIVGDTPEARRHYGGIVFTDDFLFGTFPEKIRYKLRLRSIHLSQERDEEVDLTFGGESEWQTSDLMPSFAQHGPRVEDMHDGGEPCKYH